MPARQTGKKLITAAVIATTATAIWPDYAQSQSTGGASNEIVLAMQDALVKAPDSDQAAENLALAYADQNDLKSATDFLAVFLNTHPKSAGLWALNAQLLKQKGEVAQALSAVDKALTLDGKNPAYYFAKASIYGMQKDYKNTMAVIAAGLKIAPDDENLLFSRAYAIETIKGDNVLALSELTGLVASHPDFLKALEEKALLELNTSDFAAAKKDYALLIEKVGAQEMKLGDAAVTQADKGKDLLRGASTMSRIFPLLKIRAQALDQKAYAEWQLNQLDEAVEDSREACARQPNNVRFIHDLGTIYFFSGRVDEAQILFEKELKLNPNALDALFSLGYIFIAKKDYQRAEESFSRLSKLSSGAERPYALVYAALCKKLCGQTPDFDALKKDAGVNVKMAEWPACVMSYLTGQTSLEAIARLAVDKGTQTELHFMETLNALAQHDELTSQKEILWLQNNGSPTFFEMAVVKYWMAAKKQS